MKERIKQLLCRHDYEYQGRTVRGATLSWSMRPTRSFNNIYKCSRCGHIREVGGIAWGDSRCHPNAYGADGWPLDENGEKLKIAD